MSTAPAPAYDFAPVQEVKKMLERIDLARFNSERETKGFDSSWPGSLHAMLYSDPKGDIVLGDTFKSKVLRLSYGELPAGRYRVGPRNATTYNAWRAQNARFWSIHQTPYLLADIAHDRIGSLSSIVTETTKQNALQGYNAERAEHAKQQLLQALEAGAHEWDVIRDLLRLTNALAAELQIGCRKGLVETCDLVHDFEIWQCVTSESAIAYMRSIGACNIPPPLTPRKKVNWKTDEAARRSLWEDSSRKGMDKKRLIAKWGITRQALERQLPLCAEEFGYSPKTAPSTWLTTTSAQVVKGRNY